MSHYVVASLAAVLFVYMAATCEAAPRVVACSTPPAGSEEERLLESARGQAGFPVLYPCYLPNSQVLESTAVTGQPGRQLVSLVWRGPFEFSIRQAQYPPAVSPDPSGASRTTVDLFSNTRATLIERFDGSGAAMYHLFWQRDNVYYELQAFGPPQQRRIILEIARSLE
jgi:hypothetical protein